MRYDITSWKAEDQTITRLIKNEFGGDSHKFFREVSQSYTFEEHLEMFPRIKTYMDLRDKFKSALESGEIKTTGEGWRKAISTPSLQKWCNKVGKGECYIMTYGCGKASKRDKLMKITDGLRLSSNDEDFERYAFNTHWRELEKLYNKERSWFREHDEYTVTANRVKEKLQNLHTHLPRLNSWRDAIEDTIDGESVWRELTLDEYRQLEKFADDYVAKRDEFIKNNFPF